MKDKAVDDLDWFSVIFAATRAPSSHNSQPWRFERTAEGVAIFAEFERSLPVVDPVNRELYMSCGAALEQLLLAIGAQGAGAEVDLDNKPGSPLVATVRVGGSPRWSADDAELFEAIEDRRTSRVAFEMLPIPRGFSDSLADEAALRHTALYTMSDCADQQKLVELIMQADREQSANPAFRAELAKWLRSNASAKTDGIRGSKIGLRNFSAYFAPFVVRTFDMGDQKAARDQQLISATPLLTILSTATDSKIDWIHCGQALARTALRATAAGFTLSYLNQVIEIPETREALAKFPGVKGIPQLALRIGRAAEVPASARRPISAVFEDTTTAEVN